MDKNLMVTSPPPYFSWVLDNLLAVSAFPYHHTHLRYLIEKRIHVVVSVSPEKEPPFHAKPDLKIVHFRVHDSEVPSLDYCRYFVDLLESAKQRREAILVHDMNGKNRAAVLAACYLVKSWEAPADYVIDHLRLARPISIEDSSQEQMVHRYHDAVANQFIGRYSRIQQPTDWDNKTTHLGRDYDSSLANPEGYDVKNSSHVSYDPYTNPK